MGKIAGVILNPVAGKKRGKALLPDLLEGLCRLGYELNVFITAARGDATRAARKYGTSCDLVCCIGGDGTLNEVISGLMTLPERPALCYLPAGSTNDFAAVCRVPKDVAGALEMLKRGKVFKIDLGRFEDRFFTYIASFGLFTKASYTADQNIKNLIGPMAYVMEGAKELSDLGKKYHIRLTGEQGTIEGDFIFGGIANTTSLGGIFQLSKKCVTLNDGKFEVLLIREPKSLDDMIRIVNMMQTGSFDDQQVVFLQTSFVKLESDEPISWCLDGEYAGDRTRVSIENQHQVLSLYAKPEDKIVSASSRAQSKGTEER